MELISVKQPSKYQNILFERLMMEKFKNFINEKLETATSTILIKKIIDDFYESSFEAPVNSRRLNVLFFNAIREKFPFTRKEAKVQV